MAAGLLVFTVFGSLLLPPIVRMIAEKQWSKHLDRAVTIQKVRLNPCQLSTTIRGLLIKDQDGTPLVSWDEVYVNFQLASFFTHAWQRGPGDRPGGLLQTGKVNRKESLRRPEAPVPKAVAFTCGCGDE